MKRLFQNVLLIGLLASAVFMYSCGEDTTEEPSVAKPTISLSGDLLAKSTFEVGDSVGFNVSFTAEAELSGFNYQVTINKDSVDEQSQTMQYVTPTDLGFTNAETTGMFGFSIMQEIPESLAGKTVSLYMEIVDKDNQIASETFDFEVVAPASPNAMAYTAQLLYAPTSDLASQTFFSTNTGETYSRNDVENTAEAVSPNIDFGYYYGGKDMASLAAPVDFPSAIYDLSTWGTKNDITFLTTSMTAAGFVEVSTFADIDMAFDAADAADDNPSIVTGLTAGDVIAFATDSNKAGGSKKGLIHVVEITGTDGSDGSIKLDIIVQESAE